MVRRLAVMVGFALALPASAHAAELGVSNGTLRYSAAPGKTSNVRFTETVSGTVSVERFASNGDDDEITAGAGCTGSNPYTCTGVTRAQIDAGDMSDRIEAGYRDIEGAFAGLSTIPATIAGGDGNDVLTGGAAADVLDGGAGNDDLDGFAGDDTLRGGDGNDILRPNVGRDALAGGDGIDTAVYGRRTSPVFTLDAQANDGGPGENDLIGSDVENVEAAADGPDQTVTITGDGDANRLTVLAGRGVLNGGEGADLLEGGPQDDVIISRDGSRDRVICNGGTDTVIADTLDLVSPSCENVEVQPSPGGPYDDRPPAIAWLTPDAGDALSATGVTILSAAVADDRGIARVSFFDDDRLLCEVTAAPFACPYRPRGADVGRNTLVAVATDDAGQTATAVRTVTVRRFTPASVSLSLSPSRDRRAPYAFRLSGRVRVPEAVAPSQGCSGGTVTLTAKRRKKVIATQRLAISRRCEYRATFKFKTRVAARVRFQARFGGTEILTDRSSRVRNARLG